MFAWRRETILVASARPVGDQNINEHPRRANAHQQVPIRLIDDGDGIGVDEVRGVADSPGDLYANQQLATAGAPNGRVARDHQETTILACHG